MKAPSRCRKSLLYKTLLDGVLIIVLVIPVVIVCTVIALLLWSQGQKIFYKQQRAGINGASFEILKFRTLDEDGRPTKIGYWLRLLSLDELPQLVNVIRGEMSFVGPRPLLVSYNRLYTEEQILRLSIKPGITGLAQVHGRKNLSWDEKFTMDLKYLQEMSLKVDLKVLFLTFIAICTPDDTNVIPDSPFQG